MIDNEIIKAKKYWESFNEEIDDLLVEHPDAEEMLKQEKYYCLNL